MNLAYCGNCCDLCPRYKATESGNIEDLKKVAILMKKVGWFFNLNNPEKMKCTGCQDINPCEYSIKECCIDRGIKNCSECNNYPCEKIRIAFKKTKKNAQKFKTLLSKEKYEIFNKAFFMKKENLEQLRKN